MSSPEHGAGEFGSPDGSGGAAEPRSQSWIRVLLLFVLTLALSVVQPSVLVGIPFVLLVAGLPVRERAAYLWAALAVFLVATGAGQGGLWYAERGWGVLVGGWFLALTLRWPDEGFVARALGSVAGATAVAATILGVRPGSWSTLDWSMAQRLRTGVETALDAIRAVRGEGQALSPGVVSTIYRTVEAQARVFPAMLGLASMAALGVAWWLYVRLAHGSDRGLGRLREFRFNDHLVWLFIGGLVLLVAGGHGGPARVGANAVVFMGALYALRGAAVVVFMGGGVSALGAFLLALGMLFLAPVLLAGAVMIGLGDTWLDIRRRIRQAAA